MIDEEDNTTEVVTDDADPIDGEQEQQEQQDDSEFDVEARARAMGWVDEESFRGPKHKWRPAAEWVKKTYEEIPVMRSTLRKFESDNQELRKEIVSMRDDFKAFHEHYKGVEEQAYERAIREWKETQAAAVEEADTETYHRAQKKIDEIERQKAARVEQPKREDPPPQQQQQAQPTPAAKEFLEENAWYMKSEKLRGAMHEHTQEVMTEKPYLSEAEVYAEAKQRVMQEFPTRFPGQSQQQQTTQEPRQNMRRNQAASVASPNGSTRTSPKKGKSFDDLPDDAKQEFQRFASRIPGYTKEEYVKSYRWS